MTQDDRLFDPNRAVTIFKAEQPELYHRALDARANGDGTLTHEGRLWQVGEGWGAGGEPDSYVEMRPEWDIARAKAPSPRLAVTVLRQPDERDR